MNTRIYVTALFDDKATFIDTSKTPIFEWEVAILFILLWVDKMMCLCQWYFQFLKMPQGDQLDGYIVFLYCYTLILYCASSTWIRALFDDKSNLHFLNICLCNALPENCLILSSLVFLEPGCYNNIHIHVIHVLVFWYKYLTFSFGLYFFEV